MEPSDCGVTERETPERTRRELLRSAGLATLWGAWGTAGVAGANAGGTDGPAGRGDHRQGGFDPAVHAFGFPNWFGEAGCAIEAEDCPPEHEFVVEYEPPTLPDVRDAIDSGWRVTPPAAQTELVARIVRYLAAQQLATNGHCYGMTLAAEAYQTGEAELPDPASVASEVPEPAGRYEPVGQRIRTYHTDQLLDSSGFWLSLFALEFGRHDAAASISAAVEAVEEAGTAVLTFGGLEAGHQVLAYDHEREDGSVRFVLYDPELPASEYSGDSEGSPRELVADAETGELRDSPYDYEAWLFNDVEPDVGRLEQLVGGTDGLFDRLDGAIFLRVRAPFELDVEVPDGTTAISLGPPPDVEFPTGDGVLLLDAGVGEYTLEVLGAAGEEYSLAAYGVQAGQVVVDEVVTGVNGDSVERFVLSIEDSGEGTLRRVGEDVADHEVRLRDDPWLVGGAAAAVGLGAGVAHRYLSGRSTDEG